MLRITTEDLVAALARNYHLHAARRFTCEHVYGDVGGLGHGRVAERNEPGKPVDDVAMRHHDFVMPSAEMPSDLRSIGELAVAAFAKPDRECLDHRTVAAHERHDGRGVEPTREKSAERNVANHLQLHRFAQERCERFHAIALRPTSATWAAIGRQPVAVLREATTLPSYRCRRHQFAHVQD